jgi:two-component system, NtrC family, nitrogen regulation sensor histidine kinase NtrY
MQVSRLISGNRRYSYVVMALIVMVFLIGLISQRVLDAKKNNWRNILPTILSEVQTSTTQIMQDKQKEVLAFHKELTASFEKLPAASQSDAGILQLMTAYKNKNICIEVIKNNSAIIAWKENAPVTPAEFAKISNTPAETFFYESPLAVYLCVYDNITLNGNTYTILSGLPVEKFYQNKKAKEKTSLSLELENRFSTEFDIVYNAGNQQPVAGRFYAFPVKNNNQKDIAVITVLKPTLRNELQSIAKTIGIIQSILMLIAFVFLALAVRADYIKLKNELVRALIVLAFMAALRWLMYRLGIPASLLSDSLADPSNFASQFGGGIVKSPVEFFVTALFAFAAGIFILRAVEKYFTRTEWKLKQSWGLYAAIFIGYALILLLSIRGFAASVKSVIFDSSLRYFNEPDIIPDTTHFVMNFAALVAGAAMLLLLVVIHRLMQKALNRKTTLSPLAVYAIHTVVLCLLGYPFLRLQNTPLLTYPMLLLIIVGLQTLLYLYENYKMKFVYFLLITGLCSSLITISLMNYFNTALEKESLRTTVSELNRPQKEFLRFLASEALMRSQSEPAINDALMNNTANIKAAAFTLWNQTSLKQESVRSSIVLIGTNHKIIGSFDAGTTFPQWLVDLLFSLPVKDMRIIDVPGGTASHNEAAGIIPIKNDDEIIGYAAVQVVFEPRILIENAVPVILRGDSEFVNSVLNPDDLNIVVISKGECEYAYGDFYPNRTQMKNLTDALSAGDEDWFNFEFSGEKYIVFAQQSSGTDSTGIIAVALKERELEWSFFNFFKLFIIHSFILFVCYLVIAGVQYSRKRTIPLTFKGQLMLAFLIVSIIPLIALAIFNRATTTTKSKQSLQYSLIEKVETVASAVSNKVRFGTSIQQALTDVSRETNIQFTVFDKSKVFYTTESALYGTSFLPDVINSSADLNINYAGLKEYFSEDKLNNFRYFTVYKMASVDGKQYIFAANTISNEVNGIFSPVDVDVFLFGMYSLAIIIIIGISSLMANRIAYPIKKLTLATRAVAHGDFNVQLENKGIGEMKELFNGFNSMTHELAKSQSELANMEREAAWKEFARQVAHEIKNPLTPMKLTIQQLIAAFRDKSPHFEDIFNKVTGTVLNQIETLSSIATEFSQFARMPSMNIQKLNILPQVQEVIVLFQNEKIVIHFAAEDKEYNVLGDAAQMKRMVVNFIRNSIQAGAINVEISLQKEDENIVLLISDDGKGISPENEAKIFESNFTTKSSGMGLGLKLAKRYIENTGGTITIEKARAEGAAFRITFPKA